MQGRLFRKIYSTYVTKRSGRNFLHLPEEKYTTLGLLTLHEWKKLEDT